jgi:hypothetical protein
MSELMNLSVPSVGYRRSLFATVSGLALLVAISHPDRVNAEEKTDPSVWIELGGQLEHVSRIQDTFVAPFFTNPMPLGAFPFGFRRWPGTLTDPLTGAFDRSQPLEAQSPPQNNFGGEGRISFAPKDWNWTFSASVRYGRSNGSKRVTQQTANRIPFQFMPTKYPDSPPFTPSVVRFSNANAQYSQSHIIADFEVGRDVGLGLFGGRSESVFSAGIRFAQFASKSAVHVNADPDVRIYHYVGSLYGNKFHKYQTRFQTYVMSAHSSRSFHGVGPSLSWKSSLPLVGRPDTMEVFLDGGISGAVLFGRQKAQTDHKTSAYDRYHTAHLAYPNRLTRYKNATAHTRSRSVIVPNIGAFAGLSARYSNARLSFGYRADFFFGAMDAGIDTRHSKDAAFHGPFASISVGFGG